MKFIQIQKRAVYYSLVHRIERRRTGPYFSSKRKLTEERITKRSFGTTRFQTSRVHIRHAFKSLVPFSTSSILCIMIWGKIAPPLEGNSWPQFLASLHTRFEALSQLLWGYLNDIVNCEPGNTISEQQFKSHRQLQALTKLHWKMVYKTWKTVNALIWENEGSFLRSFRQKNLHYFKY